MNEIDSKRKWRILGIIGLIIVTIAVIITFQASYRIYHIINNTMLSSNNMFIFYILSKGIENLHLSEILGLLVLFSDIIREQNLLPILKILFYCGISIAILGGLLTLFGWIKFFELKSS